MIARNGLGKFLQESKSAYLDAVKEGKGDEWTVVMGNEAGGKLKPIMNFVRFQSVCGSYLPSHLSLFQLRTPF